MHAYNYVYFMLIDLIELINGNKWIGYRGHFFLRPILLLYVTVGFMRAILFTLVYFFIYYSLSTRLVCHKFTPLTKLRST